MTEIDNLCDDARYWRATAHLIAQELASHTDWIEDPTTFADDLYLRLRSEAQYKVMTGKHTAATFVSHDEHSQMERRLEQAMSTEINIGHDWQDAVDEQDA